MNILFHRWILFLMRSMPVLSSLSIGLWNSQEFNECAIYSFFINRSWQSETLLNES